MLNRCWPKSIRLCLTGDPIFRLPRDTNKNVCPSVSVFLNEHVCVWRFHPTGHNHGGNGLWAAPGAEETEAGGDAPRGWTVRPIGLVFIYFCRLTFQEFSIYFLAKRKVLKKSVLHNRCTGVQRDQCCCHSRSYYIACVKRMERLVLRNEAAVVNALAGSSDVLAKLEREHDSINSTVPPLGL